MKIIDGHIHPFLRESQNIKKYDNAYTDISGGGPREMPPSAK